MHFDPCEAAVNQPFLYESWGKHPTFIFAYSATTNTVENDHMVNITVEDVTSTYTSDSMDAITQRRSREGLSVIQFQQLIDRENIKLKKSS